MDGKSKILVIGAAGHIGKFIAEESVKAGHSTYALLRHSTISNPEKFQIFQHFQTLGINILFGDLHDHESLVKAIKEVDVVISTVGHAHVADQHKLIPAIKEAGNVKMSTSRRRPPRSQEFDTPVTPDSAGALGDTQVSNTHVPIIPTTSSAASDTQAIEPIPITGVLLRLTRKKLHPSGKVSRVFTDVFKKSPEFGKWKQISDITKIRWFQTWKTHFTIPPELTDEIIYRPWSRMAGKRYRDTIYKAKGKPAEKLLWMTEEARLKLLADAQTEEELRISKINSANRLANPALHTGGTRSHDEHYEILTRDGREVPPIELFLHLHTKGHDGVTYVDDRARDIHGKVKDKLESLLPTPESQPTQENHRDAFLLAVGGVKPDGSVPGLGAYGRELYADQPRSSISVRAETEALRKENESLRLQIQANEIRFQARTDDLQAQCNNIMAQMQAFMLQHRAPGTGSTSHRPDDDMTSAP